MDPRTKYEAILADYRHRHPDEVDDAMVARWHQWIEEALAYMRSREKVHGYCVNEKVAGDRSRLAGRYLRGDGIEIGGLCNPLPVPDQARVRYVDRQPKEELQWTYFDSAEYDSVDVDQIDDGETLATFGDASLDFVISCHFLEHCQDPIGALRNHLRVLRPGGILYCAVPDARTTFDSPRERTGLSHLWRDHEEGPAWSRQDHYRDWTATVNQRTGAEFEAYWRMLDASDYSIHFHVFDPMDVLRLFLDIRQRLGLAFEIREFVQVADECICIVERGGAAT